MRSVLLLSALGLSGCFGKSDDIVVTLELFDDNTDDRINAGEPCDLDVFIEQSESSYLSLTDVTLTATLSGELVDSEGEAVDSAECTAEGADLTYGAASCRLSFQSAWVDAALATGELSLDVLVRADSDDVHDETIPVDLLPLRVEPVVASLQVSHDENDDLQCSPGEECTLALALGVDGADTLYDAHFTLASAASDLTVASGATGSIWSLAGDETDEHLVQVEVAPTAAPGTPLGLELRFVDEYGNAWTQAPQVPIVAPDTRLQVSSVLVASGDGALAAGEYAALEVTLENLGTASAVDVAAILSTTSPHVTVSNPNAGYWYIESGQTETETFGVELHPDTPGGTAVDFYLTMEDELGNVYTDGFTLVEGSSGIALTVDDWAVQEISGDGDGAIEPGESFYLDLTLSNLGGVLAPSVQAELRSDSAHLSLTDDSESIGDLGAGSSTTTSAGFRFTVLASHPGGATPIGVELRSGSTTVDTELTLVVD